MAVLPPALVAGCFAVAVLAALAVMVYIAWRGSKPSSFYAEAVAATYDLLLPESEINGYYDLKDKLQRQLQASSDAPTGDAEDGASSWAKQLSAEDKLSLQQALMKRLVKTIDRLDQVQRDKPGNWKLWREKLVSERFWSSLCDAEKMVGEEIDSCMAEAQELEPGWQEHIFQQAVQYWRMGKQADAEKKVLKKAVVHEKKQKEKDERRKVVEEKLAEEEKLRQERLAEKAMEKLLKEEESMSSSKKDKAKAKEKSAPKAKAKKK
jgi:hypothetical protein